MKKFFIAFLILAVTAGNVFAEITFGGELFGRWTIVNGASGKDGNKGDVDDELQTDLGLATSLIRPRFNITAVNEDQTWGGKFELRFNEGKPEISLEDESDEGGSISLLQTNTYLSRAWVWWQPISQVKATLGLVDGFRPFGVLWGTEVRDAADTANHAGGGGDIFTGVTTDQGFSLDLRPIDNLQIAVGAPIKKGLAEDSYRQLRGWAGYTVEGIGTFALGYVGQPQYSSKDASEIEFGANITAIPNLQLQFGVSYFLPVDDAATKTKTLTKPLAIALAWKFGAGDFGMIGHLLTSFAGKTDYEAAGAKDDEAPFTLGVAVTPYYNVGIGNIGIDLELKLSGSSKVAGNEEKDDQLAWEVTPYFEKAYGGGAFLVGIKVGGSNYTNDKNFDDGYGQIYWAIPVSLRYAF
jgi:hypothetical protein